MNSIDLAVTVVRQGHAGSTERRALDSGAQIASHRERAHPPPEGSRTADSPAELARQQSLFVF